MDVGDIIIIDDGLGTMVEQLDALQTTTLTVHPNAYGCVTFELPEVSFTAPKPNDSNTGEQTVYLIAYSVPGEEYRRVQGAICTKNDFRFPAGVEVRRVGLELFTNLNKKYSLRSPDILSVELEIYVVKVEVLRNHSKFLKLFPYFD